MRIQFRYRINSVSECEEWGLDSIPRIGEEVYIAGCFWTVSDVRWMLTDGDGHPLPAHYVEVYLK